MKKFLQGLALLVALLFVGAILTISLIGVDRHFYPSHQAR